MGPADFVKAFTPDGKPLWVRGQIVVTSGVVSVNVGGKYPNVTWLSAWTPANGDAVALLPGENEMLVLGKILTTPPTGTGGTAPAPPPAPPPTAATGTSTFAATDSASFRDGVWRSDTSDVIQGDAPGYGGHPNNGAWFYGAAPQSLAGAVVLAAEIYLPGDSSSVSTPAVHLYRHTSVNRPAGDVSRVAGPSDVSKGGSVSGWYPVPVAYAQAIVDSGGGIGITGSPYTRHKGLGKDGQSGALRVSWQR